MTFETDLDLDLDGYVNSVTSWHKCRRKNGESAQCWVEMKDRNCSTDFADTISSVRLFQSCLEEAFFFFHFFFFCICFCTTQRETAAVVSGEPTDDVAGGKVRSAGGLDQPLVPHRCQKGFCRNGWDETFSYFVKKDEALLSPSVL